MALFENFPYTNLQDINLKWLIDTINKIKEGQVISVNGQTGEVTLYEDASVQFPDTDARVWNVVRNANGHRCGIAFHDNGLAYILYDGYQFNIYNDDNPPPYPVTSVNGQTGDVTLYSSASVQLPDLDDQQLLSWRLFRDINGTIRGIKFDTDGKAYIMDGTPGNDQIYTVKNPPFEGDMEIHFPGYDSANEHSYLIGRYFNNNWLGFKIYDDGHVSIMTDDNTEIPLYVQGVTSPSDFTDPTDAVLELVNVLPLGDTEWGIIRKVSGADVGLLFKYNSITLEWDLYKKVNNTLTKLITASDIPAGSGVVSINTKTGVVTLYGTDIQLAEGIGYTVKQAIDELEGSMNAMFTGLATISIGDSHAATNAYDFIFVVSHNVLAEGLYRCNQALTANEPLTGSNVYPYNNALSALSYSPAYRQPGANVANEYLDVYGFTAANATILELFIPMNISRLVNAINISSIKLEIRSPLGGFVQSQSFEGVSYITTQEVKNYPGGIRVVLTKSTAWSNISNAMPVAGIVRMSYTLS